MNTRTPVAQPAGAIRRLRRYWWLPGTALCAFALGLAIGVWQLHDNGAHQGASTRGAAAPAMSAPPSIANGSTQRIDTGAVAAAPSTPLPAVPRGGAAEAIDFQSGDALPELIVYLVASQEQATQIQGAVNDLAALAIPNDAPPLNAVVVVANDDASQAALKSEYPQYRVRTVDLRQP